MLRDPRRYNVNQPWVEWARPRVEGLELSLLDAVTPFGTPFWPVFVGEPPAAPRAEADAELERVLATPPARVAAEVRRTYPRHVPPATRPLIDDPAGALPKLVEQMRGFWKAVLEPWWPRLSAVLESEIAARARQLVAVGTEAAFAGLHSTVTWDGATLSVHPTSKAAVDVDLDGRGLLLVPAAFVWPTVWPRTDPPWDPALVYPPAGIADLWEPGARRDQSLGCLVGRRRARILTELERPASTLELAHRLGLGAGSISDHLAVLKGAGLVVGRRDGRRVVYSRTPRATRCARGGERLLPHPIAADDGAGSACATVRTRRIAADGKLGAANLDVG